MTRIIVILLLLLFVPAAYAQDVLVVVQKGDDSLGFYRAESGEAIASVRVGVKPHELALSSDRRFAYVTDYGVDSFAEETEGGHTISIVDLVKREKVGEIDLRDFRRPHGIEIGPLSGRLYVTCDRPASVLVIDPSKRIILKHYRLDQSLPHMLAISKDESRAYTANAGSGSVSVIDLKGERIIKSVPVGAVPMGLALSSDGRTLYATSNGGDAVAIIDTPRGELKRKIEVKGRPARLRLTTDGKQLYVTLIGSGEVAVVDTTTASVANRFSVGKGAEGITFDPQTQTAYVSAQNDDKVVRFSLRDLRILQEIKTKSKPDPLVLLKFFDK